jgi:dolichol-phosphate mannosyltransferase
MAKLAVVIPCYNVSSSIINVVKSIGPEINKIYVIDDCCPQKSGDLVNINVKDDRVKVLYNSANLGIGGATKKGISEAFKDNKIDICLKIDGDGQMDTDNIIKFVSKFKKNYLYVKGNRFHPHKKLFKMPLLRIIGNFFLSIITKITTGQYNTFDVTNGFIAIHKEVYKNIKLENIADNFFFETTMIAEMRRIKCEILDVNIETIYKDEKSNLFISKILLDFIYGHIIIFLKRIDREYIKNKKIFIILVLIGILFSFFIVFFIKKFVFLLIILITIFIIKDKNLNNIED